MNHYRANRMRAINAYEPNPRHGAPTAQPLPRAAPPALVPLPLGQVYYKRHYAPTIVVSVYRLKDDGRIPAQTAYTMINVHQRIQFQRRAGVGYSVFSDKEHPTYAWLLVGWVVEERFDQNRRCKKFYYDRNGKQYTSEIKARNAIEHQR